MIFVAQPEDLARHGYYTGLMLVVMALYTWSFLKLWQTALVGLLLVVLYILIALPDHTTNANHEWPILIMNCFFFVSANIIGIFATMQRNRYLRGAGWERLPVFADLETPFVGLYFRDVHMEEADRIGFEFFLSGLSPSTSGNRDIPCLCRQRWSEDRIR